MKYCIQKRKQVAVHREEQLYLFVLRLWKRVYHLHKLSNNYKMVLTKQLVKTVFACKWSCWYLSLAFSLAEIVFLLLVLVQLLVWFLVQVLALVA